MHYSVACGRFKYITCGLGCHGGHNQKSQQEIWKSLMMTTRGKVLELLGLTLDYTKTGPVKTSMYEYMRRLVEYAPWDITGTAKMLVRVHLFMINLECEKLPERQHKCSITLLLNYSTCAGEHSRTYRWPLPACVQGLKT